MVVGSPIVLNLIPGGVMPVIMINETDKGYQKEFLIYNGNAPYNVPANVSATIRGTKRDGLGVTEAATVTAGSNVVRITVTEQMTAVPGKNIFELVFVDTNSIRVATANFILLVERSALNADTVISASDIAYSEQVLNQLQSVAAFKEQLDNASNNVTDLQDAFVTPIMYGAKGDGVTDDTAAMRLAIQSGKQINLVNKIYLITAPLDFTGLENLSLFGGTITRPEKQTFNTIDGTGCKNVNIHDVIFEGNGNTSDVTYTWRNNIQACCILAGNGANIVFENNTVKDFNYGVFTLGVISDNVLGTGYSSSIKGNTFINCGNAVDTYGKDVNISSNAFLHTKNAIQIEPNQSVTDPDNPQNSTYDDQCGAGCVISGNIINDALDYAIVVHGNSYGIAIKDNTIIDFRWGIVADRSVNAVISGNSIYSQKTINVNENTFPWNNAVEKSIKVSNAIITDNYFRNVYNGIYITGRSTVSENVFKNIKMTGITCYMDDSNKEDVVTISGNTLDGLPDSSAYWHGCRFICIGQGVAIIDNNVCNSERQPIYVRSTDTQATINRLYSNIKLADVFNKLSDYYNYSDNTEDETFNATDYLKDRVTGSATFKRYGKTVILYITNYRPTALSDDLFSSAIPSKWIPQQDVYGTMVDFYHDTAYTFWTRQSGIYGISYNNNSDVLSGRLVGQMVYFLD